MSENDVDEAVSVVSVPSSVIKIPVCEIKGSSYILQAFEETPTHMSINTHRLEEGHNLYPLVCRRPAETVSFQRR